MNDKIIKFRVWSKKESKYLYPDNFADLGAYFILSHNQRDGNYIFQQFTGLSDVNGKEIYEGDILESIIDDRKSIGLCKSILGGWKIFNIKEVSIAWDRFEEKIIGNIFENPELIK